MQNNKNNNPAQKNQPGKENQGTNRPDQQPSKGGQNNPSRSR